MIDASGSTRIGLPPVLIVSPQSADAKVLCETIGRVGLSPQLVEHHEQILGQVETAGCLIVTQEALKPDLLAAVAEALQAQPSWSELQVLVLASADASFSHLRDVLAEHWPEQSFVLLSRPVRTIELMGAVQLALATRLRQFSIRDQLQQERELRRELNHRVKNILATVQAIGDMTRRAAATPEEALEKLSARLEALAAVHGTLQEAAGEAATFGQLAENVLRPYADPGEERLTITGPDRQLAPEAAKIIGLCLHELATNSAKYGAWSSEKGSVELRLTGNGPGAPAELSWSERDGPEVQPPSRIGYGQSFVASSLASVFGASVETAYPAEGFSLHVSGPAETLFQP